MNETRRLNPTVSSVCEQRECGPRGRMPLHRGHHGDCGRGYGGPFVSWTSWSNGRRHPSNPYRLWQERPVHLKQQRHSLVARTQTHWSLPQKGRQLQQGLGFRQAAKVKLGLSFQCSQGWQDSTSCCHPSSVAVAPSCKSCVRCC